MEENLRVNDHDNNGLSENHSGLIELEEVHVVLEKVHVGADSGNCSPLKNSALHDSVIEGKLWQTMRILEECPDLIMVKNHLKQTALLLAVLTDDREDAFKAILDEAVKQGKAIILLQQRDRNGDCVLHVATAYKKNQIMRWLLEDNYQQCPSVNLNTRNGEGLTVKDMYDSNPEGLDHDVILLINPGSMASTAVVTTDENKSLFLNSLGVVLAVSVFLAGSIYTSMFNLNSNTYTTAPDHHFHIIRARLMLVHPDRLPDGFFNIVFMTLTFTVSMIITVVGLCRIVKGWPLCYLVLPLLGLAAFFLSYAFHLQVKVPEFYLAAYSSTDYYYTEISSYWFVWLMVTVMVLAVLACWLLAKVIPLFYKATKHRRLRSSK